MPINNTVTGDLIDLAKQGLFKAIVHGCNCQNRMGAGIAPLINNAFEGVLQADREFEIPVGSEDRLGYLSFALQRDGLIVINAYTQFTYTGRNSGKIDVSYDAIRQVFKRINHDAPEGTKIGIPLIGAGLAGGDWETIAGIINKVTPRLDITLVVLPR